MADGWAYCEPCERNFYRFAVDGDHPRGCPVCGAPDRLDRRTLAATARPAGGVDGV